MDAVWKMKPVHVRWMIQRDHPEVLAIEAESFERPWLNRDLVRCLRGRNIVPMVAEREDRVAGYMIYDLHKRKIDLLRFAIHPEFRRRGVGRQTIDNLKTRLSVRRRSRIELLVEDRNLGAQLFFRAMGFRATTIVRAWFGDDRDAYLMEWSLVSASVEERFIHLNRR